ncbi:MAG: hypothetical protein WB778_07500 [Thermoplasmata archaeon]
MVGDDGAAPGALALRRVRQGTLLVLADLFVQFMLGIWVNLFDTRFPSSESAILRAAVDGTHPILTAHLVNALLLLFLGLGVLSYALETSDRPIVRASAIGLVSVLVALLFGFVFLYTGLSNDVYSYAMAVAFLAAVYAYFVLLAHVPSIRNQPGSRHA